MFSKPSVMCSSYFTFPYKNSESDCVLYPYSCNLVLITYLLNPPRNLLEGFGPLLEPTGHNESFNFELLEQYHIRY